MQSVVLARRAERDLRRIGVGEALTRIRAALVALATNWRETLGRTLGAAERNYVHLVGATLAQVLLLRHPRRPALTLLVAGEKEGNLRSQRTDRPRAAAGGK